jgi:uncharacterized membrane protein (UPF0136 family)
MVNALIRWLVFCYAVLIIILGVVGYYRTESLPSLIAGVGSGVLLLVCVLIMFMGKKAGAYAALILNVILTGLFAYRYTVTEKLLPATLAVLSGAMLVFLLLQLTNWKK